ncbi:ATP-binding protein [Luteibacter sp. UNCMF331Sha3.1]|uniref:ATP-binding protein n=1 Tax=Luteibacter sp. UNCMF331Sha3.1 TaxID=1502760 RepID=UPI00147C1C80|nr:ATP-binding protein [Luteibacter sp. UNCMF331Sha3.1]
MLKDSQGKLTLRPSAARLLESMRDIGYSFESALADIVDNSISASASSIDIVNDISPGNGPYLAVLDNGRGMNSDELTRAMQHGSRSPRDIRDAGDLGRFGLGMKTASFSQCRRLTVVSRAGGALEARCWDLDLVISEDEWVLEVLDEGEIQHLPLVDSIGPSGTLVLWQKLDRLDALGDEPDHKYAAFNELFGRARAHLALTFHRFLAPEHDDPKAKLTLRINGAELEAADPFAQACTPFADAHEVELLRMGKGEIAVQGFTLPHHQNLSTAQMAALELGATLVETQGLYIYRARRLVSGGNWLGLSRRSELTKLLRVRVDVPTSLDSEWSIDVRKSRINIPTAIRARLRPLVQRMTEAARRPYTYRGSRHGSGTGLSLWVRVEERGSVRYEIRRDHPMIAALQDAVGSRKDVASILLAIEATLPLETLFSDIASTPKSVHQQQVEEGELRLLLAAFVEAMAPGKQTLPSAIAETILATPVFASQPSARAVLATMRKIEE